MSRTRARVRADFLLSADNTAEGANARVRESEDQPAAPRCMWSGGAVMRIAIDDPSPCEVCGNPAVTIEEEEETGKTRRLCRAHLSVQGRVVYDRLLAAAPGSS